VPTYAKVAVRVLSRPGCGLSVFLFLVVIPDLFSRKAVGWSFGDRLDADLAAEAQHPAIAVTGTGVGASGLGSRSVTP
jgi:transposase InsO family protein